MYGRRAKRLLYVKNCDRIADMSREMKLITDKQIDRTCAVFTEMFEDYPLYTEIFGREDGWRKRIYYLFKVEVTRGKRYTYANEDFTAICSIMRPDDKGKEKSMTSLFANPFFSIPFFRAVGRKQAKIALEYANMTEEIAKKYYNPETDCYIKNIGVAKASRGKGLLHAMIDEICEDMPVCLETHDETNVAIYQKLGFILLETVDFHGVNHYFMKRPAKQAESEI